ncbi:hypothetical protein MVES1_002693 [Malassezia vespertilionis]|uniref:uncharacterized protein n=1 Tax=Malassezia vespertilionis TaxID=2020962 RepID=UPI0024B1923E|nr:uncharacterized protein MVES1_002693 [Malassezia vespertilionis]WFD07330.1 hypothetical protein MVES1_002693 [Malassezia vespertilionis]
MSKPPATPILRSEEKRYLGMQSPNTPTPILLHDPIVLSRSPSGVSPTLAPEWSYNRDTDAHDSAPSQANEELVSDRDASLGTHDAAQAWSPVPHLQMSPIVQGPTLDTELSPRFFQRDYDTYSLTSTDSIPSTPLRTGSHISPLPLAVSSVHHGTGCLAIVHKEAEAAEKVLPSTTHLSMTHCALPLNAYHILQVPATLLVLDLSCSQLLALPPALAACTMLEELNVSNNDLGFASALEEHAQWSPLSALQQLRVLLADDCGLTMLPAGIMSLSRLQVLGVRQNYLNALPTWMHVLQNLECLLLDRNRCTNIAWDAITAPLMEDARATRDMAPSPSDTQPQEQPQKFLQKAFRWYPKRADTKDTAPSMPRGTAHFATAIDNMRAGTLSSSSDGKRRVLSKSTLSIRSSLMTGGSPSPVSQRSYSAKDTAHHFPGHLFLTVSASEHKIRALLGSLPQTPMQPEQFTQSLHLCLLANTPGASASHPGSVFVGGPYVSYMPQPVYDTQDWPSDALDARKFIPCFLPVSSKQDAAHPYCVATEHTPYVRGLLGYLRDLDSLCPEHQVDQLCTSPPTAQTPLTPATPMTPGTPGTQYGGASLKSPFGLVDAHGDFGSLEYAQHREPTWRLQRHRIIQEIIDTERTYVTGLNEIMDIYVKRARQPLEGSNSDERVLPLSKERAVFGHIEGIVYFHTRAFLPSLEEAAAPVLSMGSDANPDIHTNTTAQAAASIANVFKQHTAYFKMYMNYVNQSDSAMRRIAYWSEATPNFGRSKLKPAMESAGATFSQLASFRKLQLGGQGVDGEHGKGYFEKRNGIPTSRRKQIQSYLRICRQDPRHSQISLEGYLLLPIQRIPRYRMLLEQLLRCTPSYLLPVGESDVIAHALAHINLVASWVNEGKRQSEQGHRLYLWQSKLRAHSPVQLVQPHRRLVHDGALRLVRVAKCASVGNEPGNTGLLQQTLLDQPVQLLLCNDLAIVIALSGLEARESESLDQETQGSADLDGVECAAVIAVFKPMASCTPNAGFPLPSPPASITGCMHFRVLDRNYVFYFAASTHRDAMRWCDLFNTQS